MTHGYIIENVQWNPAHSVFQPNTDYEVEITLRADEKSRFVSLSPIVDSGTASQGNVDNSDAGNVLTFVVTFPRTPPIQFRYGLHRYNL